MNTICWIMSIEEVYPSKISEIALICGGNEKLHPDTAGRGKKAPPHGIRDPREQPGGAASDPRRYPGKRQCHRPRHSAAIAGDRRRRAQDYADLDLAGQK